MTRKRSLKILSVLVLCLLFVVPMYIQWGMPLIQELDEYRLSDGREPLSISFRVLIILARCFGPVYLIILMPFNAGMFGGVPYSTTNTKSMAKARSPLKNYAFGITLFFALFISVIILTENGLTGNNILTVGGLFVAWFLIWCILFYAGAYISGRIEKHYPV